MAAKKPARRSSKSRAPAKLEYYLACFIFDEFADRDSEGHFQIVVQATSPQDAADRSYALLEKLRLKTTLFQKPSSVYIEGLIRLRGSFEEGLLVNYESTWTGDSPRATISCLIPEQKHPSEGYGWSPPKTKANKAKKPEKDSETLVPFVDFGGQAVLEERALRRQAEAPRAPQPTTAAADKRAAMEAARAEAAAQRAAERASAARRRALAGTLRELQRR